MKTRNSPDDTNFILLQQFGKSYLRAAKVLVASWPQTWKTEHEKPIATLLGHSLELTLKGFISIAGMASGKGIPKTHDIHALATNLDVTTSLGLTDDERNALAVLNGVYAAPFIARYPKLGLYSIPSSDAFSVLLSLAERLSSKLDNLARQQDHNDPMVRIRLGAD